MEIKIRKNILEKNLTEADRNRQFFLGKKVFVLNMMSSPGSGKTQTLCRTLAQLMPDIQVGVVVGDICTTNDADRLAQTGARVTQINTDQFGGDCHLSASMIDTAARKLGCDGLDLLIVEISATWCARRNSISVKMSGWWCSVSLRVKTNR